MKRYFAALSFLLCVLSGMQAAAQTKRALLIGINTYQPEGTEAHHSPGCSYGRCELGKFENLEGSVNDAQSIVDVLTSPKFTVFPRTRLSCSPILCRRNRRPEL